MIPLTKRQRELLDYLRLCETAPSFEEMCAALGVKSRSTIFRLLDALEERGFVRRIPNRARAIEIIPHRADLSFVSTDDLLTELERRIPSMISRPLPLGGAQSRGRTEPRAPAQPFDALE